MQWPSFMAADVLDNAITVNNVNKKTRMSCLETWLVQIGLVRVGNRTQFGLVQNSSVWTLHISMHWISCFLVLVHSDLHSCMMCEWALRNG